MAISIYEATMKAAEFIERNPHLYDFDACWVPGPNECGCGLGWIGYLLGYSGDTPVSAVARALGEDGAVTFYASTGCVIRDHGCDRSFPADLYEAATAPRALRAYAAKYLAPPKPVQAPPNWQQMADRLAVAPRIPETA